MYEFKVGDKVRELITGTIYTVQAVSTSSIRLVEYVGNYKSALFAALEEEEGDNCGFGKDE